MTDSVIPPELADYHAKYLEARKNDVVARLSEFACGLATDFRHLNGEVLLALGDRQFKVEWTARQTSSQTADRSSDKQDDED